jgi:hypothetical protein
MEDHYLSKAQKIMEDIPKEFCAFTGNYVDFKTSIAAWGEK